MSLHWGIPFLLQLLTYFGYQPACPSVLLPLINTTGEVESSCCSVVYTGLWFICHVTHNKSYYGSGDTDERYILKTIHLCSLSGHSAVQLKEGKQDKFAVL